MRTTLNVEGMSCAHCKAVVEKELSALPGIRAQADVDAGSVEVFYEESRVSGTNSGKPSREPATR